MKNGTLFRRIIRLLLSLRERALTKEGTETIVTDFNKKVNRVGGIKAVIHKLKVMYAYFRDPNTSKWKKGLAGAALLYFLLPADVIPDFIPIIGYIDDVTAALFVWNLLSGELDQFEEKSKKVVIDVEKE